MQIRTKLYAVVFLSILVAVFSTAILNLSIFSTEIVRTLNHREELNLREIKSDLESKLKTAHQALETLRSGSEVKIFLSILKSGDTNSELAINLKRSLRATQSMLQVAADINIVDPAGDIVMSSSEISGNIASTDLFEKTSAGYQASDFVYAVGESRPSEYQLSAPVKIGGDMLGMVVISVHVSDLFHDIREKYELEKPGTLCLLDEKGNVISHVGFDLDKTALPEPHDILERISREDSGHIAVSDAVMFFSSLTSEKWHLLTYAPKNLLYKPVIKFRNACIAVYLAIFAVAFLGAKFLIMQIIPRLKKGLTYAEAVANGDISGTLDDNAPDELGRLFRAIDTMVRHLRSAYEEAKIQEQKATEIGEELFLQNSQLEMIVHDRTQELDEAQKHIRLILDLTTESIFELDNDGIIKSINSTAAQMFGYDESELLGQEFFSVTEHNFQEGETCVSPDCEFRNAVTSHAKQTLSGIWMRGKCGNNIPVTITVSPMLNHDGERIGTIIAIIDTSDLIRTGRMMQALYETADEGYIFFSQNFDIVDCNKALVKLLKAPSRQHIIENFALFSPPRQPSGKKSADTFDEYLSAAARDGESRFEWRHQDIHGVDIPCYITMTRIDVNKESMFIAAVHDLSDQKKAESALLEQREQLQEILDSSPTTMAIIINGTVRKVNDKGIEMLGIKPGDSSNNLYVDIGVRKKALAAIGLGAQVKNWEVQMNGADGEILDTLMSLHPFVYEGKPSLLVWVSDVTELTRARILAEEAAKAKSDFLASMSHEIRTPMNAIIGMTHLCIQTDPNEKQMNYLVKIQRAASVLLSIINDILDFSKIESGKFTLENIPFRLTEVLKGLWDLIAFRAEEKGVAFSMDVDENIPEVMMGDPLRINQILVNLCNNSVKFTERGSISLKVSSSETSEVRDGMRIAALRFDVSDTGIGMTDEQTKKLFKPFTQADGSITRKYGGSGLGLSISKHLVENMDGSIWVESRYGEGSTFSFVIRLPIVDDYENLDIPVKGLVSGPHDSKKHDEIDARVLLVEDNDINQEIAVEMLEQFGAKVDVACNGQEAIDILEQSKDYDIVFMDVQMPIMDGLEATRRIRLLMGISKEELPIIAMTAHAMKGDYDKSIDAGMNDHITKPIDPDELYESLKRWVENSRANRAR